MASIYTKGAEKTLILAPREGVQRAFDFDDWSELRLGMFFSGITTASDDGSPTLEQIAISSVYDRIFFGIKNSDSEAVPGVAGSLFVGVGLETAAAQSEAAAGTSGFRNASGGAFHGIGYYDTTLVDSGTDLSTGPQLAYPYPAGGATAYCGVYVARFIITNRGAATQSIAVSGKSVSAVSGSNYTSSALLSYMNSLGAGDFTGSAAVAWNDGAAARVVPDAFYLRVPFYNNRIRLSAMAAKRYS